MMFNELNLDSLNPIIQSSSVRFDDEFVDELKEYNKNSRINKLNKDDYREKINRLYDEIGNIKPIDNEINDDVYFDNFDEVGLVINSDISLKQVWTEYRLIYNEKIKGDVMGNSFVLDNFDELYERISKKVDGLDRHINDLNFLKSEIDVNGGKLKSDRENFEIEKITFENYKREETARLEMLEKELNNKLEKINNLILQFDEKMNTLNNK